MRKTAGLFGFAMALLFVSVTQASAISIFSTDNATNPNITCTSGTGGAGIACGATSVFKVQDPLPGAWAPNGTSAKWISYNSVTSQGGNAANPNNTLLTNPTITINYDFGTLSAPRQLNLLVWADDTATVRGNNGIGTLNSADPLATYGACASSGITCGGAGTLISVLLPVGHDILSFDLFQRGGNLSPFGLMFSGDLADLTATPEPATILLLGSALAAAGAVSRRRPWRKSA